MISSMHPHAPQPSRYKDYLAFHQAHSTSVSPDETIARWAHYQILVAISNHRQLKNILIFKGGNALRSAHGSVRATRDLDFSIQETLPEDDARKWLDLALRRQSQQIDILLRVQSFKPKPKHADATRRTWHVHIGYALKSHAGKMRRLEATPPQSSEYIPLEISENEAVGIYAVNSIDGAEKLYVSTVENIIAEKLRALLQQRIRDRYRAQDVFDIAYQCRRVKNEEIPPFNLQELRNQFEEKCRVRNVPSDLDGFKDDELWSRAERDYQAMKESIPESEYLPFAVGRAEIESLLTVLKNPFIRYFPVKSTR